MRLTSASEKYDNQHTITDTFANTSVPYATRAARMNAAVLASLALAPCASGSQLDLGVRAEQRRARADADARKVGI